MSSSGDFFAIDHLAMKLKMVTPRQLAECQEYIASASTAGREPPPVEDVLVERGYLGQGDLESLRALCDRYRNSLRECGYEILDKLGQGAMGTVYRSRHLPTGRTVAVKILSEAVSGDPLYLERFRREAQAAGSLHHDNIVSGIEYGDRGGIHYFVMEFVDGVPLGKVIRDEGRVDEETALQIVYQIAGALDYASSEGVIHRDIKPDNIMLSKDGTAKLCDLGLAKRTSGEATLTQSGFSVGTPYYISPEQAMGRKDVDARTDIYSLGATLFHAVCGRAPFLGSSPALVMTRHINDPLPDPAKFNDDLSENTRLLIRKMMAKEPAHRHDTPRDLMRDVQDIWNGKTISLKSESGFWDRTRGDSIYGRATVLLPGVGRRSRVSVVVVAVALLAGAALALFFSEHIKATLGLSGTENSPAAARSKTGAAEGDGAVTLPWGRLSPQQRQEYLRLLARDPDFRKELAEKNMLPDDKAGPAANGGDERPEMNINVDQPLKMLLDTLGRSGVLEQRDPRDAERIKELSRDLLSSLEKKLEEGNAPTPAPSKDSRLKGTETPMGITVYEYDDLARELAFTPRQKDRVAKILLGGREQLSALMIKPQKDGKNLLGKILKAWLTRPEEMREARSADDLSKVLGIDDQEHLESLGRVHDETNAHIRRELNPAQLRRYDELINDPFLQIQIGDSTTLGEIQRRRYRRAMSAGRRNRGKPSPDNAPGKRREKDRREKKRRPENRRALGPAGSRGDNPQPPRGR